MSTFHPSSQRADFATCAARWGWVSTRAQMLPQSCYLGMTWRRAQGKSYYTAGGGTRFWLTEEGLAERRAEGKTMEPIDIDYKEGEAQERDLPALPPYGADVDPGCERDGAWEDDGEQLV